MQARMLAYTFSVMFLASALWADGTETLGDASIPVANGNRIVAAGTGMQSGTGTVDLDVPAGALVQVIAYWSGAQLGDVAGDGAITLDGVEVVGTPISDPAYFFTCPAGCGDTAGDFFYSAFRADITALGLVDVGSNTLSVAGMDFTAENSGVGLVVIVDEGLGDSIAQIKDGVDLAFAGFPAPRDTTVAQTYTFDADTVARVAEMAIFAGSVGSDDRTSSIHVTVGGTLTAFDNVLMSSDGTLWDTVSISVEVPAGATELTVQVLSTVEATGFPASVSWIGAGMAMLAPANPGEIGDYVWCDDNDDGVQDAGEHGIPGVTVFLTCAGDDGAYGTPDDLVLSTTTDDEGHYLFEGIPAGSCSVSVDPLGVPGKEIGMCPGTVTVELGPGESYLDADFCFVDVQSGGDGCTPGYWKNHLDSWEETAYEPEDIVSTVFSAAGGLEAGNATLEEALRFGGGGGIAGASRILLRAAVASLLNASHPDVSFGRTAADVIDDVNDALASGHRRTMLTLATTLDNENNSGCPLN